MINPQIKCFYCRQDKRLPQYIEDGYEDDICARHKEIHVPNCPDYSCGTCPRCKTVREITGGEHEDAIDLDAEPILRYDEEKEIRYIFDRKTG